MPLFQCTLLLITLCATAVTEPSPTTAPSGAATLSHTSWNDLLQKNVKDGLVNYANFAGSDRPALAAYLDSVAAVDVASLSRPEQLALYLNLYNAGMIAAVADRYTPEYSVVEGKMKIFSEPLIRLGGETITLDKLEHELIRKGFGDARVHAAMVCAGLSCPPLPSVAFEGNTVDAQLDACMKHWLTDPRHTRIDVEARRVTLSKIFRWYAKDFGGPDTLPALVNKYTGTDVSGFEIGFFQYDWRLNDLSPAGRPGAR